MTTSQEKIQEIRRAVESHVIITRPKEYLSYLLSELDAKTAESELWQKQNKLLVKNNVTYKEQIESLQQLLDAAKQENERLQEQLDHDYSVYEVTINRRQELLQRLKQAEAALEWYADKQTYKWTENDDDPLEMPTCPILDDGGQQARISLLLIRGEETPL